MGFGEIADKMPFVGSGSGGIASNAMYSIIGIVVLALCGFGLWWLLKEKKDLEYKSRI